MMLEIQEFLGKVNLFQRLDQRALDSLAEQVRLIQLPEGYIIHDLDPVDGLYIVRSGTARVSKAAQRGEGEAVLALLGPGESFGEIALIDGLPRSANVIAMEPMECYFLGREAFLTALGEHPDMCLSLLPALATMVRTGGGWIAELL